MASSIRALSCVFTRITPACLLRALCVIGVLTASSLSIDAMAAPPATAVTNAVTNPAATNATTPTTAVKPAPQNTVKPDARPLWSELTPAQQQVLMPLASEWSQLDSNPRAKWVVISNKYPSMRPEQQKRLQENIRDWAKMTPEQHRLARESYIRAKKLNDEQKNAQWQQYQQLPEKQKQELAADTKEKRRVANIPSLQSKPKSVQSVKPTRKATNIAVTSHESEATAKSGASASTVPAAAIAPSHPAPATVPPASPLVPVSRK